MIWIEYFQIFVEAVIRIYILIIHIFEALFAEVGWLVAGMGLKVYCLTPDWASEDGARLGIGLS